MDRDRGRSRRRAVAAIVTCAALAATLAWTALAGATTTTWSQTTDQQAFNGTTLNGVGCVSTSFCETVGQESEFTPVALGFDGTTWSRQTVEMPSYAPALSGIACLSATNCIAVGEHRHNVDGPYYNTRTLIEAYDGSKWSQVGTPSPGPFPYLFSVACVAGTGGSDNLCTAVGQTSAQNAAPATTMILEGRQPTTGGAQTWTWTLDNNVPNPGLTNGLHGVNCPTYGTCFAVGFGQTSSGQNGLNGPIVLEGTRDANGGWTWTRLATDNVGGSLNGISCTSATSCLAVGSTGSSPDMPLVERWNGEPAGFSAISPAPPRPGAFDNTLKDISCISSTNCSAVGSYTDASGGPTFPLVVQWDGAQWLVVSAPTIDSNHGSLARLVCDTPSNTCFAVGTDPGNALVESGLGVTPAPKGVTSSTATSSTPAATPAATAPRTPAPTIVANPRACLDTRRFTFALHHNHRFRIVDAKVYVNARLTAHKSGRSLSAITIPRLPQRTYTVRIVTTQSTGSGLISTRTYRNCVKSASKTRHFGPRR